MASDAVSKVLEISGYRELNPAQRMAVDAGLLEGKSMVVAAPTASGKTLIAEMAALNVIRKNKKVVYIVPLKALAAEKHDEFREKYEKLGIRVAVSSGDLDSSDPWLASKDLIIATSEKLDSLMRHGIEWINDVGLVIADEIHLLDSANRGPTLEVTLTRLRQFVNPQILGLSATISNHEELAEWLGAEAVKSDYRPITLYRGLCFDDAIDFIPQKKMGVNPANPVKSLVSSTLDKEKQILFFVSTRRSTQSAAEKIGSYVTQRLKPVEKQQLEEIAQRAEGVLEHPTQQCRRLGDCIRKGTAFHHAGLTSKQRKLIEGAFREGHIKAIAATPTLAMGMNLPAFRTVVRDLKRFSSFRGMDYLPALEIEQMSGRAGRPKYDEYGEAILIAKNRQEADYAWQNYINGEPEKIYSKLGVEPVLRMHVMSLIASGAVSTRKELFDFFAKTFHAFQYRDMEQLKRNLERVLELLKEYKFIDTGKGPSQETCPFKTGLEVAEEESNSLTATRIGKRVSELYIDPLTAHMLIKRLEKMDSKGTTDLGMLHAIADTIEMRPLLHIRKGDLETLNDVMERHMDSLVEHPPEPWDMEYDEFLRAIKTAGMLLSWAEESGEEEILQNYGVTPGELRARLERADWLLYASQELGLLLNHADAIKGMRKIRVRLKYGVREELLPLVRLKGIGRVKSRALFHSGIKSLSQLKKAPMETVERLVGPKTARSIKEQAGDDNKKAVSEY